MKNMQLQSPYMQKFTRILPISFHSSYEPNSEYSDKLILPPSIFFAIKSHHLPVPPVFSLRSNRDSSISVTCGVLEFTAEEDSVYCPLWVLKKIGKQKKYSNGEGTLQILQSAKRNVSLYPHLKRLEVYSEEQIENAQGKQALMMYTVINKGEWISIMVGSKVCKVFIMAMLPRNKCVIKNSNFDLIISDRFASSVKVGKKEPSQDPPLFEALPITLLAKERPIELRKSEAYTPWEHRVQPLRLREEGIDLLPWDKEEIVRNEITTQTLPDIISPHPQKNSKPRKILTLAFPQIHVPDRRPLTTLDIDIMYKSVSNSPNAQKSLNNRHKNSMF